MPHTSTQTRIAWTDVPEMARARSFRNCVLGVVLFNVPFWLCGAYSQVFYLDVLKMRETTIASLMVGYFGVRVLMSRWFGRLVDRLGPRRLLAITSPLYFCFFGGFWCSTPERIWPVFVGWTVGGIADAAYGVALNASIYQSIPQTRGRPAYFAVYNMLILAAGATFAAVAVPVLRALHDADFALGPVRIAQFQALYLISFILFLPVIASVALFPAKRAKA